MTTYAKPLNKQVAECVALFAQYADTLASNFSVQTGQTSGQYPGILNGEAAQALLTLVPLEVRKETGIFFTSTDIANKMVEEIAPMLKRGISICDPASGAGNLLVACAQHFPLSTNLQETLIQWSAWISGYDLFPEFIRAAKLRLLILAMQRHNIPLHNQDLNLAAVFENLSVEDVLDNRELNSECIVLNPPFGYMPAPKHCSWASGQIQTAGWFLEKILKSTPSGRHIVALLPDVLNSGSRYQQWRNTVVSYASSLVIKQAGKFDPGTDVDVFLLHMITGKGQALWPRNLEIDPEYNTVSDFFEVRVGSVVPHRDPEVGEEFPYIHARTAPGGQTLTEIEGKRKFKGTVFKPPFVLVHRTSSPSDKNRCVSTIVNVDSNVAVENHLLVCLPNDGSLSSCKKLLKSLASEQTTDWMNNRIRCRHLTVRSLKEVPFSAKRRKR